MRVAVVTGASSGIGREFVRQLEYFYKDLDEIWVIARREERLEQLRKEVNVPLRIFAGDLQKKHVYRQFYTELCQWHPNIRMLVNAAGFGKSGTFSEIAEKGKRIHTDMIDLNCTALIRITQMTLPYMKMGSRIINMASAAAFCPQPSFAVYAASKACVLSFSRALGQELREKSIYVTAVCPGPVETEFFEVSGELKNPLKKLNMAAANKVVHRALIDSRKKKSGRNYDKTAAGKSYFESGGTICIMKKTEKGMPGYLNYKRKIEIIRTLAYFGIVIAILLLGYFQTGTKLNLLTVVAIVGCLPASKALVGVITRFPYRSIDGERAKEIASKTDLLTVCYDMVITSRDHIMPVDCIVISGHNIFGYTHYNKVNTTELADHIKTILAQNGYKGFQIRILNEYKPFITRAEGLNNIAAVEQEDTKTKEETVRGLILNISM